MSDTAFQVQYRQQFIDGFELRQSFLRSAVTTEVEIKGNQAVFLVADSGSATAVTRGVNGLIPARADNLTQNTCTLVEWHDLVRKTSFNIFASQGNQVRIMQETSMGVVNRKVDLDIIAELDAGTTRAGATAVTGSLALVMRAWGILGNLFVPVDQEDNMFGLITPAFYQYLMQTKEFAHADYVDVKPFSSGMSRRYRRWAGINWIVHPNLTGVGTSSEKCYIFHRSAIGHALDKETLASPVGYMEEQDYSYARTSGFFGSKLLQNNGVCQMLHDGSAIASA